MGSGYIPVSIAELSVIGMILSRNLCIRINTRFGIMRCHPAREHFSVTR
jgi:hypothetical protein